MIYLERCTLEALYSKFKVSQEERPGVYQVDPVHGHQDDTVPTLEASGEAVFDEKGVREHKAMLLVSKENWTLASRAHLTMQKGRMRSV